MRAAYGQTNSMERWREHYNHLLNPETNVRDGADNIIPQQTFMHQTGELPTSAELDVAIKRTKGGKAAGPDGMLRRSGSTADQF